MLASKVYVSLANMQLSACDHALFVTKKTGYELSYLKHYDTLQVHIAELETQDIFSVCYLLYLKHYDTLQVNIAELETQDIFSACLTIRTAGSMARCLVSGVSLGARDRVRPGGHVPLRAVQKRAAEALCGRPVPLRCDARICRLRG